MVYDLLHLYQPVITTGYACVQRKRVRRLAAATGSDGWWERGMLPARAPYKAPRRNRRQLFSDIDQLRFGHDLYRTSLYRLLRSNLRKSHPGTSEAKIRTDQFRKILRRKSRDSLLIFEVVKSVL